MGRESLVPAAAVIPAPQVYSNVAAVKKFVVDFVCGCFYEKWAFPSGIVAKWRGPLHP